eukprot:628141-Pyramimonas_sp.AAC.1
MTAVQEETGTQQGPRSRGCPSESLVVPRLLVASWCVLLGVLAVLGCSWAAWVPQGMGWGLFGQRGVIL